MSRMLVVMTVICAGLVSACDLDFGTSAAEPPRKQAKEFYDRVPQEPAHGSPSPTS